MYILTYTFVHSHFFFLHVRLQVRVCEKTLGCHKLDFIMPLTHANVWESVEKPCSCVQFLKSDFYYKSCENPYQYTSHTRIHISTTLNNVHIWTCNEIRSSDNKIIITIVPSYTERKITCLLLLALLPMLHSHNNTDRNKLMMFFGITLYYGDTHIHVI